MEILFLISMILIWLFQEYNPAMKWDLPVLCLPTHLLNVFVAIMKELVNVDWHLSLVSTRWGSWCHHMQILLICEWHEGWKKRVTSLCNSALPWKSVVTDLASITSIFLYVPVPSCSSVFIFQDSVFLTVVFLLCFAFLILVPWMQNLNLFHA